MKTRKQKDFEEFLHLLPRLETAEAIGVLAILGADFKGGNNEEDNSLDVASNLEVALDKFLTIAKPQRKELLKVMRKAARKG